MHKVILILEYWISSSWNMKMGLGWGGRGGWRGQIDTSPKKLVKKYLCQLAFKEIYFLFFTCLEILYQYHSCLRWWNFSIKHWSRSGKLLFQQIDNRGEGSFELWAATAFPSIFSISQLHLKSELLLSSLIFTISFWMYLMSNALIMMSCERQNMIWIYYIMELFWQVFLKVWKTYPF